MDEFTFDAWLLDQMEQKSIVAKNATTTMTLQTGVKNNEFVKGRNE